MDKKSGGKKPSTSLPQTQSHHSSTTIVALDKVRKLQDELKQNTDNKKQIVVTNLIELLDRYHSTSYQADEALYSEAMRLCIMFYVYIPDYQLLHPNPLRIMLTILEKVKDIYLPKMNDYYRFIMKRIEEQITLQSMKVFDSNLGIEAELTVSFDETYDIFHRLTLDINYKKTTARLDKKLLDTLCQLELDMYQSFINILSQATLQKHLTVSTQSSDWHEVSLRLLLKVFNQVEANKLSLTWITYYRVLAAVAPTKNPNIEIIFQCFRKLKALNFFDLSDKSQAQSGSKVKRDDLHDAFTNVFHIALSGALFHHIHTNTNPYLSAKFVAQTSKVAEYLITKNLVKPLVPILVAIFAYAPYEAVECSRIMRLLQEEYPYTSEMFSFIFQALYRCKAPHNNDLRLVFNQALSKQLLCFDTPDTRKAFDYLFKALSKITEPQKVDIQLYFASAIQLPYANLPILRNLFSALTKVTPFLDEADLLTLLHQVQGLPDFTSHPEASMRVVDDILVLIEKHGMPSYQALITIANCIDQHGFNTPKQCHRLIRILITHERALIQNLSTDNPALYREYTAQHALAQQHAEIQADTHHNIHHQTLLNVIAVVAAFAEDLVSERCDETYYPSEKLKQLAIIRVELAKLISLAPNATRYDFRPEPYYYRVVNALRSQDSDLKAVQTAITAYQTDLESTQIKADKLAEILSLDIIWEYIKSYDIDKLEKANASLDYLIENPEDTKRFEYFVAKINCLIHLGHYDKAMVWLGRTKSDFQHKNDLGLRISLAVCCKKLGQFTATIAIRADLHLRLTTPNRTHQALINQLELAL